MNARIFWIHFRWSGLTGVLNLGRAEWVILFVLALTACSREEQPTTAGGDAGKAGKTRSLSEPDVAAYAAVLSRQVNTQGLVNYKALKANRQPLDCYVASLASLDPQAYEKWNDEKKIAFWINAYNGLTLETIINHYPIKKGGLISGLRFPENSIRQIPGAWDGIKHAVMGKRMTLDDIEHGTLRKQFHEPRIHMALVCAAKGCPPLNNVPYTGERLDAQLTNQAQRFFANTEKFRIVRDLNAVYLSSIFKWFGADFARKYETDRFQQEPPAARPVLEFASRYARTRDAQYLKAQKYRVEYLDYDWSLNEP